MENRLLSLYKIEFWMVWVAAFIRFNGDVWTNPASISTFNCVMLVFLAIAVNHAEKSIRKEYEV